MDLARENRRLMAQVEHLSGDDHVRREAEPWRGATPAERLAALSRLCRQASRFLAGLDPDAQQRAVAADPLPPDSVEILRRLRRGGT